MTDDDEDRARILKAELLADDWATLTKYTIDFRRSDGRRETQVRQVYDRGDGAGILPVDLARGTVLLIRQFRIPVWFDRPDVRPRGMLIEVCAGRLDENDPEATIHKEAEEELGYRLHNVRRVFNAFMSPGSVSERLSLFMADYSPVDRVFTGGGAEDEGEDIEVLELALTEAMAMVADGRISDAKTIMLIQHTVMTGLADGEKR